MLIGKEVTHEYRGRGTVVAQESGVITVPLWRADYDLDFPYPGEFTHMLKLRQYDPEAQAAIDADIRQDRLERAEAYRRRRSNPMHELAEAFDNLLVFAEPGGRCALFGHGRLFLCEAGWRRFPDL